MSGLPDPPAGFMMSDDEDKHKFSDPNFYLLLQKEDEDGTAWPDLRLARKSKSH